MVASSSLVFPTTPPKMSTYQELENEFNKKVKNLQKICKHPFTEWLRESWAPGHSTGYEVFICQMCEKQINKRPL